MSALPLFQPDAADFVGARSATAPAMTPAGAIDDEIASVLSPTQVGTFIDCAARWYFGHCLQLPEPRNASLAIGTAFHRALRVNWEQKVTTRVDLPVGEVLAAYSTAWLEECEITEFRDEENPRELLDTGLGLVNEFMTVAAPGIQPAEGGVEKHVTGVIGGVKVQGYVDVLDVDGTTHDTKTAAKNPSGLADYMLQLSTYPQITPGATRRVKLHVVTKTKVPAVHPFTRTLDDQDLRVAQTTYPLAQEAMRQGVYLPNRKSFLCSRKNCPFWRACEKEFGGHVEET